MTTITANSTIGITLSSPSYTNPVLINPGVTISGGAGIYASTGSWTVQNSGTIAGNATSASGRGILLIPTGSVTNQSGGVISGYDGIYGGNALTVVNYSSITGVNEGVFLEAGGSVTNQSAGVIGGYIAIEGGVGGALTVVNAGTISGTKYAIEFDASFANRLVIDPGAVFSGTVQNATATGAAVLNTLELASGTSAGTLTGLGSTYVDFATVTIDSGATWVLAGSNTLAAGATLTNFGKLTDAGTLVNGGSIGGGGGTLQLSGGTLTNLGSGVISAAGIGIYGLRAGGTDTVTNQGTITAASGYAIYLAATGGATGIVNNAAGALIAGYAGVKIYGANASIGNLGTITATATFPSAYGIYLRNGGTVTNGQAGAGTSTASIQGYEAGIVFKSVDTIGQYGTLANYGTVVGTATYASGVLLENGGTVINGASGATAALLEGGRYGVSGFLGSVVNYATIFAAGTVGGDYGVGIQQTGTVGNLGTASLIEGYSGVLVETNGTVTNAGTIEATGISGYALKFVDGDNKLAVDPGAVFIGTVTGGGGGGTNILELASGSAAGTLSGLGTSIINFGSISFDTNADWFVAGNTAGLAGTISGFTLGDTIEITGITVTGSNYAGGVLTLDEAGGSATLNLPGAFTTGDFIVTNVSGGAEVGVTCFATGTRIRTPRGEIKVEDLTVGDQVSTLRGKARPIIWIGTGKVMVPRGRRSAATPVIVRKGALGDNVPNRDLHVTKGHSLYLDDVLIPVEFLVNHRSILWDDWAQEVTIYHIELATHDVLLANGTPAESYRDDGNRWLFQNSNAGWFLPPQPPCAPVVTGGAVVDAAWRQLLDRSGLHKGLPLTDDPDLHLLVDGKRLDAIDRHDDTYVFRLPSKPRSAHIMSYAAVPQELGIARDARALGVAVRRIVLAQSGQEWVISSDDASLDDGYHAFEVDNGLRWTTGDAAIPPWLFARMNGAATLVLQLGAATQYIDEGVATRAA